MNNDEQKVHNIIALYTVIRNTLIEQNENVSETVDNITKAYILILKEVANSANENFVTFVSDIMDDAKRISKELNELVNIEDIF